MGTLSNVLSQVPAGVMQEIQANFAQGQGTMMVDPTTGLEFEANVGMTGDTPTLQQIVAGDPNHFTNGDNYLNFDTKSGALTGQQQFSNDTGFGSFLLKSGLGIAGLAMGAGAAFGGLGGAAGAAGGAALPGGGAMDVGGFEGIGDFMGGGATDSGFALAGSDSSFASALSDSTSGLAGSNAAFTKALTDAGLSPSSVSSLARTLGGALGGAGGIPGMNGMGMIGPLLSSLIGGINQKQSASTANDLAQQLIQRSDPFYQYRAGYGQKLADLEAHPENVSKIPGYQAGLDAVERSGAAQGFTGSGNMMKALQDYGGNFYNQELSRLGGLAGANVQPGAGFATAAGLIGAGQREGAAGNQNLLNSFMSLLGGVGGIGLGGNPLSPSSGLGGFGTGGSGNPVLNDTTGGQIIA